MANIDIGSGAIDRNNDHSSGYTCADIGNSANDTGGLNIFELWASITCGGMKCGTCYGTLPNLTPRDYETIGSVTAGSKQQYLDLDCDVATGDYAMLFWSSGAIEMSTSGGSGIYRKAGDQFGAGQQTYTLLSAVMSLSIYGTGVTPEIELTGTIAAQSGVTGELTSLAQATGWKSPGTVISTGSGTAWASPDNAKASDDARATVSLYMGSSQYLRCTNFDFSEIPGSATSLWIEIKIERSQDAGGGSRDETVRLRKTSGQVGDNKALTGYFWPEADAYMNYGGEGDNWNAGLTVADLKDSGTGIDISAYANALSEARIDHVQMRVWYTLAQVTEWKSPGTCTSEVRTDAVASWNNPGNAASSNDVYTTAYETTNPGYTYWLRCTSFDFTTSDIPAGSIIRGIELRIERKAQITETVYDSAMYLRKTSGQIGGNKASSSWWLTNEVYVLYGGEADLWGATLADSDIKNNDFGIDISAWLNSFNQWAYIDHIQIRVWYVIPPSISGTVEAQSVLQGALSVARKVAGAIAAQTGVTGALKIARELAGACTAEASVQAALRLSKELTGTAQGQSLVQGILKIFDYLTGTVAAQSAVEGILSTGAEEKMTGAVTAQAAVQGELDRVIKIAGAVAGQSGITGELAGGPHIVLLAGIIAATTSVEGSLAGIWTLTGEAAAQADVEAFLTVPGEGQLQGQMFMVL